MLGSGLLSVATCTDGLAALAIPRWAALAEGDDVIHLSSEGLHSSGSAAAAERLLGQHRAAEDSPAPSIVDPRAAGPAGLMGAAAASPHGEVWAASLDAEAARHRLSPKVRQIATRDTARAMSQENVEAFKRASFDAINRRDVEGLLEELDPEVEWHPGVLLAFEGETRTYRGHEGVREMLGDLFEALAEFYVQYPEIRDLGDRIVAIGHVRTRGRESGAVTESPFAAVTDFRDGKAVRIRTYLDPKEALEAAGLSE
jgi:ketosteroid isomerase-like protein